MNIKQLIAAVIVLAATGTAFAQPAQANTNTGVSGKTRAQVIAELQQAQADGSARTYGFLGLNNPAAAAGNAAHK